MDSAAIQRTNQAEPYNYPPDYIIETSSKFAGGLSSILSNIEAAKAYPFKISKLSSGLGKVLGGISSFPKVFNLWNTFKSEVRNPKNLYDRLNAGSLKIATKASTPIIIGGIAGAAVAGAVTTAPIMLGLATTAAVAVGVEKGLDAVERGFKNLWQKWF